MRERTRLYTLAATLWLLPAVAARGAVPLTELDEGQIDNDPNLNYDPARGPVTAPLLLWGPYLWANGTQPRVSDGLVWLREDLRSGDGTHPSESGKRKVAQMLLDFVTTDANARTWFLK